MSEQLQIEILPAPQTPGPFSAAQYINEHEGMIHLADLPEFDYDPERPLDIVTFLGEIGVTLSVEPPRSATWDKALDAHGEDYQRAARRNLNRGLYFSRQASRGRPEVITITSGPGVAVTGQEFTTVSRSATDLLRHIQAKTEAANDKRPPGEKLDEETLRDTKGRSGPHAMRAKMQEMAKLREELQIQRAALVGINYLATSGESWPMADLDAYREVASEAIHGAAKVASRQLGYGTTTRNGIHRAITSRLYRSEPAVRTEVAKAYTQWAGLYVDAKRGKIYQSFMACYQEFQKSRHYLKTKKPTPTSSR